MASLCPTMAYNNTPNLYHTNTSIFSIHPHLPLIFSCSSSINQRCSSSVHLHRSFSGFPSNHNRPIRRCGAGIPGPPPEQPDPPPDNQPGGLTGITASLSRLRDSAQIFLAVLFWMSLFFWASAWDGKNSGGGNNANRFRK